MTTGKNAAKGGAMPPEKLTAAQRRVRYAARKVLSLALVAAVLGGLMLADHFGCFGRVVGPADGDFRKYNNKTFRVVRVIDGDTLDVSARDGQRRDTRIRLWGVDTPETVKPNTPPRHFAREATARTKELCAAKDVKLQLDPGKTRDKYDRLLAYVFLPDGEMLNRVLVREGYAYADPRYSHRFTSEFSRLQQRAEKKKLGLWKDVRPDDLPYYLRGQQPRTEPPPRD